MKNNNYSHIKSFADFREEKMRLYYEIRLAEKKLEIKKLELREFLNPFRFASSLFTELAKPIFLFIKSVTIGFFEKRKSKKDQKKSSDKSSI